jgi:hypothetical protein
MMPIAWRGAMAGVAQIATPVFFRAVAPLSSCVFSCVFAGCLFAAAYLEITRICPRISPPGETTVCTFA